MAARLRRLRKGVTVSLHRAYDEPSRVRWGFAFDMSKKYQLVRDKIPLAGGGFAEALRMALVDFSCLGQGRHLDLTGYPHASEEHALMSDWAALGVDFRQAVKKVVEGTDVGAGDGGERPAREPEGTD